MSKISIPFLPRFKEPMLNGTKTVTTRSKRYGWKGDTFDAFGATFQIEEVYIAALSWIAKYCWQAEGCSSEQDFVDVWKSIHFKLNDPRSQWHVHRFKKVEKPCLKERNESNDKEAAQLRADLKGFNEDLKEQ